MNKMTYSDFNIALGRIEQLSNHYAAEQQVRPSAYNEKQLKKLDKMAVEIIARYEAQLAEPKLFQEWYLKRWISYPEYLRLTKLPF